MRYPLCLFSISLALMTSSWIQADVSLPHIFGNNMVLQRDKPVSVWGNAAPQEKVTVAFAGQSQSTTAGEDGKWSVVLAPLHLSNTPAEFTVTGTNSIKLQNVLVGEVWVCSGQSNMEKPLINLKNPGPGLAPEEEAKTENHLVRLLKVTRNRTPKPLSDLENISWSECNSANLGSLNFSAVAYYFGQKINHDLNVPVGLIESSFGGSPIEPWLPKEELAKVPSLADYVPLAEKPWVKGDPQLSMMYNGMIAPLLPYAIRGVLWYQGESNVGKLAEVNRYADKMFALIQGWRSAWHDNFPFYYVQIAPFTYFANGRPGPHESENPEREAVFWEQQTDALAIPKTGMVVITDAVDDVRNHHPHDKKTVGERLALLPLAKDYGRPEIIFSGPQFQKMEVQGNCAKLQFNFADGLKSRDGQPLTWFSIAGADGNYVPATATIEGNHVLVSSATVPVPVSVRFAWGETAMPNLCNGAGLPAIPFRTDAPPWPMPK